LFRRRRLAHATPEEATRERSLDIVEGMAEYTGWRLSGSSPDALPDHVRDLPEGDESSWVRGFPYHTGPAYGYLLDACGRGWRRALVDVQDLQVLLDGAVPVNDLDDAEARGDAYGRKAMHRTELARQKRRQARIDTLTERFAASNVVRIRPRTPGFTFDPRKVTPLAIGTVYQGLTWRTEDGAELSATAALVTPDWSEIWVPLDSATRPSDSATLPDDLQSGPTTLTGDGWSLRLTPEWRIHREGEDNVWWVEPAS
jgi:hypothetical protein